MARRGKFSAGVIRGEAGSQLERQGVEWRCCRCGGQGSLGLRERPGRWSRPAPRAEGPRPALRGRSALHASGRRDRGHGDTHRDR